MERVVADAVRPRTWLAAVVVGLIAAVAAGVLVVRSEQREIAYQRERVAAVAQDKAQDIRSSVEHSLAATYALAAMLRQGRGEIRDFDTVAQEMLAYYPGASALQLMPGGVIRQVVPLQGNERAIGHDLMKDPQRTAEAFLARDTGRLTLAGPFELVQGGTGAVGRLPVFLPGPAGERFWGFVGVLMRFPDALASTYLERLEGRGFRYELWRIRPDNGERQVIAASSSLPLRDPVSHEVPVPNGTWTLSLEPADGWGDSARLTLKAMLALLSTLLLAALARYLLQLRLHRADLQGLVDTRSAEVRAREADLDRTQTVAHVGGWKYDIASGEGAWSAEACRIVGLVDGAPVTYARVLAQVPPDERARVDAAWAEAFKGVPSEIEHRIVADGAVRWVRMRADIEHDAGGHPRRVVGTVQDITAAHAAEEQLRRLFTAVENSPASIVITDCGGMIEYVNPQFEQSTGYSGAEVIGQNPRILKSGNRSREEYAALWATITAGGVWRGEFENVRKDGSHFWEMASIAPIRARDGRVEGFVAVKEDITERKQAERERVEREAKLAALVASLPEMMFVIDRERRIVEFHAPAPELLLMPPARFLGRPYAESLPPAVAARLDEALDAIAADHMPRQIEYVLDLPGGPHHFDASVSRLNDGGSESAGFIVLVRDISQRVRYEERMREAMVVFTACSQGIMTTDADGVITSVNPAFCAITGYDQDEVIGRRSSIFKSGRHDPSFYEQMWVTLIRAGAWEGEIWNRRKNGDTYPQWLTISAVRDGDGQVLEYVSLFSDITERKQQEQAIWRQANFDPLTGLANRSLLQNRLDRALAQAHVRGRKVGLMFIDLDGFKWINDSLGHDVGDQLLIEVAHRLKACVREHDTVARLGGDEFTVVVQDILDPDTLGLIAEKLVAALREPFLLGSAKHHVSGSVGITVFPDDGDDLQTLLRNADIAMYTAKQGGKNRARFYAHHMRSDALARVQLEAELRAAVEQRQFLLHYQPIVDAASGRLVGAEALIRWRHPRNGLVAPASFVSVAEDCGLIVPIGEWALAEAVGQALRWRKAGHPRLRLAMNISGVQLREPGLPEHLRALLDGSGAARDLLVLEITESVLIDGSEYAEARMREIRELGVVYALDDFGTGFSSLSCLKRFPVEIVKIDGSFVRDCSRDRGDARLVEAIVGMAHSLDLRVTAEGVETVEQRDFLRALGCDYLQGFLVGKPVPAAEFDAFLEARVGGTV